jgi:hypothetical protein
MVDGEGGKEGGRREGGREGGREESKLFLCVGTKQARKAHPGDPIS